MRVEPVEIYSDQTNMVVMKHPGRHYPGSLIQGDSLYMLCCEMDEANDALRNGDSAEAGEILNAVRNRLWDRLNHYKVVLGEHQMQLPFSEQP